MRPTTPAFFAAEQERIGAKLATYTDKGLKTFSTSSFQPQSVALLHILAAVAPETPILFLNTGYHFAETLAYRDQLAEQLKLNIVQLKSNIPRHQQRDSSGQLLYTTDQAECCAINKVQPLDAVLPQYDVWINGIRKGQNANRAQMQEEQPGKHNTLRYHPILEWQQRQVFAYISHYKLPLHPLMREGYFSIGCAPCTRKSVGGAANLDDRSGRWQGSSKNECGLHTDLVAK